MNEILLLIFPSNLKLINDYAYNFWKCDSEVVYYGTYLINQVITDNRICLQQVNTVSLALKLYIFECPIKMRSNF